MQEIGLNALVRACKYSAIPNELGFCGPANCYNELVSFIECPSDEKAERIKVLLSQFNALFPYLELIALSNQLQPFDEGVIEAYWVGNSLLENVRRKELQKTVLGLQRFGFPKEKAEQKAAMLPDGIMPHHSFHVLYINFINPKVKPLLQNLNNCLIQWGEVKQLGEKLRIKGIELFYEGNELKLREKEKGIENPYKIELKKGSIVSVHWNKAIELLSAEQFKNLQKYTLKTLEAIQKQ